MYTDPLGYFITFRCYGTWLHGDARGSVEKSRNVFNTPVLQRDVPLEHRRRASMQHPEVKLNQQQRLVVAAAIEDTCRKRNWLLHAASVRTNHVHAVLSAGTAIAEQVLNALKANATRLLREEHCWSHSYSPWSSGGSTRYLWREQDLTGTIHYVLNCQD